MSKLKEATILELNLISAQLLKPAKKSSKMIQTYVVAYMDSKQKLCSRVDKEGHQNPTWNDKFIFVVDGTPSSCIVFEIYQVRRFKKDKRLGSVNVLIQDLMQKSDGCSEGMGMKFMAFHVRNWRSDIAEGILNIGVVSLYGVFQHKFSKLLGSKTAIDHRTFKGVPV